MFVEFTSEKQASDFKNRNMLHYSNEKKHGLPSKRESFEYQINSIIKEFEVCNPPNFISTILI